MIIIEKGDTLWKISHSILGAGNNYEILWEESASKGDPNVIFPGMVLNYSVCLKEEKCPHNPKFHRLLSLYEGNQINSDLAPISESWFVAILKQAMVANDTLKAISGNEVKLNIWFFLSLFIAVGVGAAGTLLAEGVLFLIKELPWIK